LHELKRLYHVENWEFADRTLMVTSLPYHYVTLVKKALTELKGVIETEDESIVKEIEKNFVECLNSFADNMHYLAFESDQNLGSGDNTENDYDNMRSQNSRLLIILNNCCTTRTKHVPELIKKYRTLFKLPYPFPDSGKDSTNSLIEQLETMVMNKYLKSKIALLSARIKTGLLLEGFDLARSQPYQGIRDYVIDVLIHMVFVHEELVRISPPLVTKMLSLLLEHTYQLYIEWLHYVDALSVYGKLQVGMELQFIDQIMDQYRTESSRKLGDVLDALLDTKNLLDPKKENIPPPVKTMSKQIIDNKVKTTAFLFECFYPEKEIKK